MNNLSRNILTACLWEATARKAGNVHRIADFEDLTYLDFVVSATAIAPVLELQVEGPLGVAILEAIRATRSVVNTNTNLGLVLLLAPLTKCRRRDDILSILDALTIDDANHVYEAIRLAVPGGLGKVENQDVADAPTQTLSEVMALAADRDLIARQYANGFRDVLELGVPALMQGWDRFESVEAAILHAQLHFLSRFPDSLIVRKRGIAVAEEVLRQAGVIDLSSSEGRNQYARFDRWLRADGHSRNPGTTADLLAASLFVALQENRMDLSMPFTWKEMDLPVAK